MKNEKEIKQKIYDLKMLATSTYEEEYIKQKEIDILEWVLNNKPKFKIGDKVFFKNKGCEFLGTITLIAENNRYFVRKNYIINELCLDESVLVKLHYKRLFNFKNN